jgi:hypothetical protein
LGCKTKIDKNREDIYMASEIRDINLAESGLRKIEWVRRNCPLLSMLKEEFTKTQPFKGQKIALVGNEQAQTALFRILAEEIQRNNEYIRAKSHFPNGIPADRELLDAQSANRNAEKQEQTIRDAALSGEEKDTLAKAERICFIVSTTKRITRSICLKEWIYVQTTDTS